MFQLPRTVHLLFTVSLVVLSTRLLGDTLIHADTALGATGIVSTSSGKFYFEALLDPEHPGEATLRLRDENGVEVPTRTSSGDADASRFEARDAATAAVLTLLHSNGFGMRLVESDKLGRRARVLAAESQIELPNPLSVYQDAAMLAGDYDGLIFFETRIADVTGPDGEKTDDVSARFMDAFGNTFFASTGGHEYPEAWRARGDDLSMLEQLRNLAAIASAGRRLASIDVAPEAASARDTLVALARAAEEHLLPENLPNRNDDRSGERSDGGSGKVQSNATTRYWRQQISIYAGPIKLKGVKDAEHSATRVKTWQSKSKRGPWALKWTDDFDNHGRAPGESGMKYRCSSDWTEPRTDYYYPPMCSSAYDWWSLCGGHNCHDDTLLQFRTVQNQQDYSTSGGTCSSCSGMFKAPKPSGCD